MGVWGRSGDIWWGVFGGRGCGNIMGSVG